MAMCLNVFFSIATAEAHGYCSVKLRVAERTSGVVQSRSLRPDCMWRQRASAASSARCRAALNLMQFVCFCSCSLRWNVCDGRGAAEWCGWNEEFSVWYPLTSSWKPVYSCSSTRRSTRVSEKLRRKQHTCCRHFQQETSKNICSQSTNCWGRNMIHQGQYVRCTVNRKLLVCPAQSVEVKYKSRRSNPTTSLHSGSLYAHFSTWCSERWWGDVQQFSSGQPEGGWTDETDGADCEGMKPQRAAVNL